MKVNLRRLKRMISVFVLLSILLLDFGKYINIDNITTVSADSKTIQISTAKELSMIGKDNKYPLDGNYILTKDIDLVGINWEPIGKGGAGKGSISGEGVFSGSFDGNGHKIKNLNIEKISDPTISSDGSGYVQFGLFGTVAGSETSATIKNIVFENALIKVTLSWGAFTSVGVLVGDVNGKVNISNISINNASIEVISTDNQGDLVGAGGLIGECRTDRFNGGNSLIYINDIFSDANINATNPTFNAFASGIVGRIRETAVAELTNVVSVGEVLLNGTLGNGIYNISNGDRHAGAELIENIYFLENKSSPQSFGSIIDENMLKSGELSLSKSWRQSKNSLPSLNTAKLDKDEQILSEISIVFADDNSLDFVNKDIEVPILVEGESITWVSNSTNAQIGKDGKIKIILPEFGIKEAVLTATFNNKTKDFNIRIVSPNQPTFSKKSYSIGDTLEVINTEKGITFDWYITNMITNTTREMLGDAKGKFLLEEKDLESMIVVKAKGYDSISFYFSKLPVIYIDSSTSYNAVTKEAISYADMRIQGNAEYSKDELLYEGKTELKLRGNSTAALEKKPFKLKLDKKSNLLGLGSDTNKHWVLLANALDSTLLRNKLLLDFSGNIGAPTNMKSTNTVLIYNGEYQGVYQLCEHVRIDKERIDVFDWTELAEDIAKTITEDKFGKENAFPELKEEFYINLEEQLLQDYSWMDTGVILYKEIKYYIKDYISKLPKATGGYLAEMDFYAFWDDGLLAGMTTAYNQPMYFNSPEPESREAVVSFKETQLYKYAAKYTQTFEYALHSDDFFFRNTDTHYKLLDPGMYNLGWHDATYEVNEYKDEENDGMHYSELFDMNSLVVNFIFTEFAMNWDSMKNSFFYYKDIDELAVVGPNWDYDWAFGNKVSSAIINNTTDYPTNWHTTIEEFTLEQYYQSVQWNRMLIRDPYFLAKSYELYNEVRLTYIEDMIKEGGLIDTYFELTKEAAKANDVKWKHTQGYNDFDTAISEMTTFIDTRVEWLDEQFVSFETFINSLGYYQTSDYLNVEKVDTKAKKGYTLITAKANDEAVKEIMFQVNGTMQYSAILKGDTATIYVPDKYLNQDKINLVEVKAKDEYGEYIVDNKYSIEGNYNIIHSNYQSFEKTKLEVNEANETYEDKGIDLLLVFVILGIMIAVTMMIVLIKKSKNKKQKLNIES